jgi:MFS transporter, UMF1 family
VRRVLRRRPVLAWAFYDWANSAFATTVMAGFFPVFFKQHWNVGVPVTESTFRLGLTNGIASAVIALTAPVLGAIADRGGARVRLLMAFTVLGAAATAALALVPAGQWVLAATLYLAASLGFWSGIVFNDSLLLHVAEPPEYDLVSGFGYSFGYLGGGLLFAVNVVMTLHPGWFGLADAAQAVKASFVMVGVWWFLFALPLAFNVREPAGRPLAPAAAIRQGFTELGHTVRELRRYRPVLWFLAAYWLYIDGVNTVIKMAVDYGLSLGFAAAQLLAALLLTQFVAFPAALAFGWLGARIGARRGIFLALAVYAAATCYAYFLSDVRDFYLLAVVIGLVQGGVQSLSRSYFGRLVPEGKSSEFFGFYNMMGKFAAVLGPLLTGTVAKLTGDPRLSIVSIVLLFVAGAGLLGAAAHLHRLLDVAHRRIGALDDLLELLAREAHLFREPAADGRDGPAVELLAVALDEPVAAWNRPAGSLRARRRRARGGRCVSGGRRRNGGCRSSGWRRGG